MTANEANSHLYLLKARPIFARTQARFSTLGKRAPLPVQQLGSAVPSPWMSRICCAAAPALASNSDAERAEPDLQFHRQTPVANADIGTASLHRQCSEFFHQQRYYRRREQGRHLFRPVQSPRLIGRWSGAGRVEREDHGLN